MSSTPVAFDSALVSRFDRNGPRYTSYPTADRFVEAFGPEQYRSWAGRRNIGGIYRPLAIYVHLPFCRDVCFYCACNKIVTRDAGKTARYLEYLGREIELQAQLFRDDLRVAQMHWGGGTPTYYDTATLRALHARIAGSFQLAADGDYSIEIDPRTVDAPAVHALREMGFNRVSFGVQDFEPAVQVAVHRLQSAERTLEVIEAARGAGFDSINIDLIYGLPKQTLMTFNRTLAQVLHAAAPHRALQLRAPAAALQGAAAHLRRRHSVAGHAAEAPRPRGQAADRRGLRSHRDGPLRAAGGLARGGAAPGPLAP